MQVNILRKQVRGRLRCAVRPAHVKVRAGDTIRWSNRTGARVTLFVPVGRVVQAGNRLVVDIGKSAALTRSVGGPKGEYPYAVYCHGKEEFAEGASHPDIIVG